MGNGDERENIFRFFKFQVSFPMSRFFKFSLHLCLVLQVPLGKSQHFVILAKGFAIAFAKIRKSTFLFQTMYP
jgi:hypothetical protein